MHYATLLQLSWAIVNAKADILKVEKEYPVAVSMVDQSLLHCEEVQDAEIALLESGATLPYPEPQYSENGEEL